MADVRLRHGWLWLAVAAFLLAGAALLTSRDPTRVRLGIALLVMPLLATTAVLWLYYWKSRR